MHIAEHQHNYSILDSLTFVLCSYIYHEIFDVPRFFNNNFQYYYILEIQLKKFSFSRLTLSFGFEI